MTINDWNQAQVKRAETTWGQTVPPYSKEMFDFLINNCNSFLDLGCGFGRFLEYLPSTRNYIGYDSSQAMVRRITRRFPDVKERVFHRSITEPILHRQEGILVSAVLIHLKLSDQNKVLKNLISVQPKAIAFDINSPSEKWLSKGGTHFEKIIPPGFRMTWQSHYVMTKKVMEMFSDYHIVTSSYPVNKIRFKFIYKMLRKE